MVYFSSLTPMGLGKRLFFLSIIASDNGLLPDRHQAIIEKKMMGYCQLDDWEQILILIWRFSLTKMHLIMSSVKCRPFWLSLNVLKSHIKAGKKILQMFASLQLDHLLQNCLEKNFIDNLAFPKDEYLKQLGFINLLNFRAFGNCLGFYCIQLHIYWVFQSCYLYWYIWFVSRPKSFNSS